MAYCTIIYSILPVHSQSFVQLYDSLKACFLEQTYLQVKLQNKWGHLMLQ